MRTAVLLLVLAFPAVALADDVTAFRCGSQADAEAAAEIITNNPTTWRREITWTFRYSCSFGPSHQATVAEQHAAIVSLETEGEAVAKIPGKNGKFVVGVFVAKDELGRPVFVTKVILP